METFTIRNYRNRLSEEDVLQAKSMLESDDQASKEVMDEEREKTEKEKQTIACMNDYFKDEFKRLGIDRDPAIAEGKVHMLSNSVYREYFPDAPFIGFYHENDHAIFINEDEARDFAATQTLPFEYILTEVIFHEGTHLNSYRVYRSHGTTEVGMASIGYMAIKETGGDTYFEPLNEAVVNGVVTECFSRNKDRLRDMWGYDIEKHVHTPSDTQGNKFKFAADEILEIIIQKVAAKNNATPESVWDEFKRGLYTGNKKHFKDIEKACGRQSVRILAIIARCVFSELEVSDTNPEQTEKILHFFQAESEDERRQLAKEIFSFQPLPQTT